MVDKAIDVATQESAILYFAERIARTEKARAYMDGAMYQYAHDPDYVAFKWKLSSRHPCDDICDLYAHADLWGWARAFSRKISSRSCQSIQTACAVWFPYSMDLCE